MDDEPPDPGTEAELNPPWGGCVKEEFGHGTRREVAYLAVHSVLHLLGYDHMDEGPMKAQMREREEAILEQLGIGRA